MSEVLSKPEFRTHAYGRRAGVSHDIIKPLFALFDALIVLSASVAGNAAYQLFINAAEPDVNTYAGIGLFAGMGYLLAARHFRLYELQELMRPGPEYGRIFAGWLFVILLLSVFFFLMKLGSQVSRGSVICFLGIALFSLVLWRGVAKQILKKEMLAGGIRGRRALVLGTGDELASFDNDYLLTQFGIDETERVVLQTQDAHQPVSLQTIAVVQAAVTLARTIKAHEVIVALPWGHASQLEFVKEQFQALPLAVRLLPDEFARSLMVRPSGEPQLIDIKRAPLSRTDQLIKRLVDVVIAALAVCISSLFMLVAAIAIRLDSAGPVIFRQRRKGFDGQEFVIYKFRTMQVMEDGQAIAQATQCDPRVTRLGALLRRSSFDELPQLFNVLQGHMSLVGPRPHAVAHDDQYAALIAEYAFRHHVKPGITGLAQVNGFRGEIEHVDKMKERIDLDRWYIENWSLWLDLQILARTSIAVISRHNAY